jgi:hypothetical protein
MSEDWNINQRSAGFNEHPDSPAFPCAPVHMGMSLRDYFAAAALPTVLEWIRRCSTEPWPAFIEGEGGANGTREKAADTAYAIADAMLEARKR